MNLKAIILGFKTGVRRLDSRKSYPMALVEDRRGRRMLDWTLEALSESGVDEVVFVGGYHIEKVVQHYPNLQFSYNPDWESGSDAQALRSVAHHLMGPCLVTCPNVVFRPNVLAALMGESADIVLARKVEPLDAREPEEFAGLALLSSTATAWLRRTLEEGDSSRDGLGLACLLLGSGLQSTSVDVGDDWALIHDPRALSRFVLGTKAETLERLWPLVSKAEILDQICFTVRQWRADSLSIIERIQHTLPSGPLIVRSSALGEDSWRESQAGAYRSEVVDLGDRDSLRRGVELVIESFSQGGVANDQNQVFVQPFLENVILSGVLLSRDPDTSAPYFLINYDDRSERTDTVTSGRGEQLETVVVYRNGQLAGFLRPELRQLLDAAAELEELVGHDFLDVEFAIDQEGKCCILQVRPLVEKGGSLSLTDQDVEEELSILRTYVEQSMRSRPHLEGETTVFANMPDWNPAEIIGTFPRPLAWSLYRYLITDRVWGEARTRVGYRDTYPEPLIVLLAGHPYVDVRASLNSFLPVTLDRSLSVKLVHHYLDRLHQHPQFHDKLEFEVAFTCLDFDFERQSQRLLAAGFNSDEVEQIRHSLGKLTGNILKGRVTTLEEQLGLIGRLHLRRERALAAKGSSIVSLARTVRFLLDDCTRFGTLPFSILARYAFMATSFLRSLEARKVVTPEEHEALLRAIPTVASEITMGLQKLARGELDSEVFLNRFGHLRPGTYDIRSPSYAEEPEFYLSKLKSKSEEPSPQEEEAAAILDRHQREIEIIIATTGNSFSYEQFKDFVLTSIPAREKAKFEFTKNLSAALVLILEMGKQLDLSCDDLSFLPITRTMDLATDSPSSTLKKELQRVIGLNRKRYALHKAIKLPHMIRSPEEIDCFKLLEWLPNFITSKSVTAPLLDIDWVEHKLDISGKIVLIKSADPGYDWILGRGIVGILTQFGGVASHMAIRAAELGLPAAIGCGEVIYERIRRARLVELDCAGQRINIVH